MFNLNLNYRYCFMLKARISAHDTGDTEKEHLRTDGYIFPPIFIRVVPSTGTRRKVFIIRIDVKGTFGRTGPAQRDLYVVGMKYSNVSGMFGTAAYSLIK